MDEEMAVPDVVDHDLMWIVNELLTVPPPPPLRSASRYRSTEGRNEQRAQGALSLRESS